MPDLMVLSIQLPGNDDEHMLLVLHVPRRYLATLPPTSAFLLVDAPAPSVDGRYELRAHPWMRDEDTLSLTYHSLTL